MTSPGSRLVLFLTVFIDLLGFGIVLPLLPIYAKYFTDDPTGLVVGLLMASFSAMQLIFAPFWGRLSDRVGRRPVLMVGLGGSVVFYALFGLATVQQSLTLLFVSRIGAGIFGATISTAQAYIADTTTLERRSRGMALIGMAFGLGFTFGPLFGFLAVTGAEDQPGAMPGYVAAALSAVALLLAIFLLPESRPKEQRTASDAGKVLNFSAVARALSVPSIGLLMLTLFVCVFSFANFETTLSIVLKGKTTKSVPVGPFAYTFQEVCLTYAFIGFMLMLVQGGLVRRLSGRVPDATLAATGAAIEVAGFVAFTRGIVAENSTLLFVALALVVAGFAFMTPSINGLISRRSDPARQGVVLGLGQSVNSLARLLGPMIGLPLLHLDTASPLWPFWLAAALMAAGGMLVLFAARRGRDYSPENPASA